MNIRELKKLIDNLPDHIDVFVAERPTNIEREKTALKKTVLVIEQV